MNVDTMINGEPGIPPGNPIEVPPEHAPPDIPPGGPLEAPEPLPELPPQTPTEVPPAPSDTSLTDHCPGRSVSGVSALSSSKPLSETIAAS